MAAQQTVKSSHRKKKKKNDWDVCDKEMQELTIASIVVVPTLVESTKHGYPVQLVNLAEGDLWLQPQTTTNGCNLLSLLSVSSQQLRCISVTFRRIMRR